jgi:TPP-dependent pyruvate/acetoin dehydrogenase alpha subunit
MRSVDFGTIPGVVSEFSREEVLSVFRRMCASRFFDFEVKRAYDEKHVKIPIYLSVGEEALSSALSVAYPKPAIFAQHRCHDLYLAYGADPAALVDELLGRETGCAKGMGGSASIHSPSIPMFGHSGLMGDQIPIAVGYALGKHERVLAVMGDASAEEDYVLGAMAYASHKKLPILFVCNDNGLSILTEVAVRRNWKMADVARSFGMEAVELADDPWSIMHYARALSGKLPAFMNIHTVRHLWHSGTGVDGEPEWNRFMIVKADLEKIGLKQEADAIEEEERRLAAELWHRQLYSTLS